MMRQCETCLFYSLMYDENRQMWDDTSTNEELASQKHFCQMYDDSIDMNIVHDKKQCKFYVKKD